ncbi:hypothetical protein A2U01_0001098 [Trifolium medium]|uniref:Uncharacterized protein n=1 Tax=Trifolium medium TaxID=97028 RepID=A0A392LZB0_9FABA|nr:hypothetical protein [Trifolium medium]
MPWAQGQGSTWAQGQGSSPLTEIYNFLGVDETDIINQNQDNEQVELLGRGHRARRPPDSGTGSHRHF